MKERFLKQNTPVSKTRHMLWNINISCNWH